MMLVRAQLVPTGARSYVRLVLHRSTLPGTLFAT